MVFSAAPMLLRRSARANVVHALSLGGCTRPGFVKRIAVRLTALTIVDPCRLDMDQLSLFQLVDC